jgi:hypothetical protein
MFSRWRATRDLRKCVAESCKAQGLHFFRYDRPRRLQPAACRRCSDISGCQTGAMSCKIFSGAATLGDELELPFLHCAQRRRRAGTFSLIGGGILTAIALSSNSWHCARQPAQRTVGAEAGETPRWHVSVNLWHKIAGRRGDVAGNPRVICPS